MAAGDTSVGSRPNCRKSRVVCLYRGDEWLLPDNDTRLVPDHEVVIITAASNLELLTERWGS